MSRASDPFTVKHVDVKLHPSTRFVLLSVQMSITGSSCCSAGWLQSLVFSVQYKEDPENTTTLVEPGHMLCSRHSRENWWCPFPSSPIVLVLCLISHGQAGL